MADGHNIQDQCCLNCINQGFCQKERYTLVKKLLLLLQMRLHGYIEKKHPQPLSIICSSVCVFVPALLCVCPSVIYILIPSGGLFTPPAGSSSHIVDHPWPQPRVPGVGWHERALGEAADAHAPTYTNIRQQTHAHTQTLIDTSSENCFAIAGNYCTCPLVNVPSNSFNSNSL